MILFFKMKILMLISLPLWIIQEGEHRALASKIKIPVSALVSRIRLRCQHLVFWSNHHQYKNIRPHTSRNLDKQRLVSAWWIKIQIINQKLYLKKFLVYKMLIKIMNKSSQKRKRLLRKRQSYRKLRLRKKLL